MKKNFALIATIVTFVALACSNVASWVGFNQPETPDCLK